MPAAVHHIHRKLTTTADAASKRRSVVVNNRTIETRYYGESGQQILFVNKAKYARRAVLHAVDHMQENTYDAFVAEVWDTETGELHAVVTRSVTGEIRIIFHRDPLYPLKVIDFGAHR